MSKVFSASGDAITLQNTPLIANVIPVTYCATINPTGYGSPSAGRIINKADPATGKGHALFLQNVSGGQLVGQISKSGSDAQAVAAFLPALFNNEWKFVAMTYKAGDGGPRLWLQTHAADVVELAYTSRTDGAGSILDVSGFAPIVGNSGLAGGNAFQGKIDDPIILAGVLSAADMRKALLQPRTAAFPSAKKLAHWILEPLVQDITGNGAGVVSVAGTTQGPRPGRETQGSQGW